MFAKSLDDLQLDEAGKIGYTYKCLGAGFWSLRQNDFRAAIEAVAFEVSIHVNGQNSLNLTARTQACCTG